MVKLEHAEFHRQEIKYAPISISENGIKLSEFIEIMIRRLLVKSLLTREDAFEYSLDVLKGLDCEFGDKEYIWNVHTAWDLLDEEMQYWEKDSN